MKPRDELYHARKTIGECLMILRNKELESYKTISLVRDKLSLALRLQSKIIKNHPELKRIRVKQMNLFKRCRI
jgi:hypothetical protein